MTINPENLAKNKDPENRSSPSEESRLYLAFEELSTPQLDKIDKQRAVVLLPIGPLEEHGPHLPFGVDAFTADFVAGETVRLIREIDPGITIIKVPVLHVGAHVYRRGGSLWVRQRVIRDMMIDYGRSLARHGFTKLVIVSAHGGPRHFVALEEAARIVSRRRGVQMISLTSRLIADFLAGRYVESIAAEMKTEFTAEDKKTLSMDYHAGWWETSMMLMLKPHLVDSSYKTLSPALVSLLRVRPNSPWTTGPGLGYLGAPARASVEFAKASTAALRPGIKSILKGFLDGNLDKRAVRSPLYYIPIFRTNFRSWLFALVTIIIAALAVWIILT